MPENDETVQEHTDVETDVDASPEESSAEFDAEFDKDDDVAEDDGGSTEVKSKEESKDKPEGDAAEADTGKAEGDKEKEKEKEPGGEEEEATETEDGDKSEEEGEPETDPLKRLEQRQKAEDDAEKEESDKVEAARVEEEKTKAAEEKPQGGRKPLGRLTLEDAKNVLEFVGEDVLPEGQMTIGNREVDFDAIREENGEVLDAATIIAVRTTEQVLRAALDQGMLQGGQAAKKEMAELRAELADLKYWGGIADAGHPDGRALNDTKDFQTWFSKQSGVIQKGAKSQNPQDAADIFQLYKNDRAKAGVDKHDNEAGKKFQDEKDLHGGSSRNRKQSRVPTEADAKREFDDEFDKDD